MKRKAWWKRFNKNKLIVGGLTGVAAAHLAVSLGAVFFGQWVESLVAMVLSFGFTFLRNNYLVGLQFKMTREEHDRLKQEVAEVKWHMSNAGAPVEIVDTDADEEPFWTNQNNKGGRGPIGD